MAKGFSGIQKGFAGIQEKARAGVKVTDEMMAASVVEDCGSTDAAVLCLVKIVRKLSAELHVSTGMRAHERASFPRQ